MSLPGCDSAGRSCSITAHATNASKLICKAFHPPNGICYQRWELWFCFFFFWLSAAEWTQTLVARFVPLRRMVMHWPRGFLTRSQGEKGSSWSGNHSVSPGREEQRQTVRHSHTEHTLVEQSVNEFKDHKQTIRNTMKCKRMFAYKNKKFIQCMH